MIVSETCLHSPVSRGRSQKLELEAPFALLLSVEENRKDVKKKTSFIKIHVPDLGLTVPAASFPSCSFCPVPLTPVINWAFLLLLGFAQDLKVRFGTQRVLYFFFFLIPLRVTSDGSRKTKRKSTLDQPARTGSLASSAHEAMQIHQWKM